MAKGGLMSKLRAEQVFIPALEGKKIPLLTLDNKWHQIFTQTGSSEEILKLTSKVNNILKRQGKLNDEIKRVKVLKKKLMDEIVNLRAEANAGNDRKYEKKFEESTRLISECNDKIEAHEDELMEIPRELNAANRDLMIETMNVCYRVMQENTKEIAEIGNWITNMRIQLKKNIIKKQEKEIENHQLYSYMHDIFGADVIDIFDMKYTPTEKKKQKNEDIKT